MSARAETAAQVTDKGEGWGAGGHNGAHAVRVTDIPWSLVREPLRREWNDRVDAMGLNPTLRPEWLELAAGAWGLGEGLRVAILSRGALVIGIVPFLLRERHVSGVTLRVLELAGNVVSYHQEIVAQEHVTDCLAAFLEHVAKLRWDAFIASGVVVGGATDRAVAAVARRWGCFHQRVSGEASPYVRLAGSWDAQVASLRSSFRYRVRRAERQASGADGGEMRWYRREEECAELLSHVLAIEDQSWKRAEGMSISARREEISYYEAVLPMMARGGMLFGNVFFYQQQPVSYSLCYARAGCVGQVKTSFDERFGKIRPGLVAIVASIRRAIEEGYGEYDFLGESMRHKSDWTDMVRAHVTHVVFGWTLRGMGVGSAKAAVTLGRAVWGAVVGSAGKEERSEGAQS